ncbi:MAG: SHOCT domain-containing protein [Ilumatobacteraceae bacterium]
MTNLGDLPAWAQPIGTPAPSSKKRKDKKAKAEKAETPTKSEKPATPEKTAKAATPEKPAATETAAPAPAETPTRRAKRSGADAAVRSPELPAWAGGAASTPSTPARSQQPVVEPEVEEAPAVELVIDPNAPVHPEYGRRITIQQFSTKRIEVFEHAAVRIEGPLSPNPPFETLMSISFTRPEEKRKGRLGKLIDKATATSYQALGEIQPLPEACLTIVTDVRTHEVHEAPPSPESITAGLLLVAAAELATASPAEQARVFAGGRPGARHQHDGPSAAEQPHDAPVDHDDHTTSAGDVDLEDDTGDYSRDRVVELAAAAAAPAPAAPQSTMPTFSWDLPSPGGAPAGAADVVADPTPTEAVLPSWPEPAPAPEPLVVEPLMAEITRAVEEAASSLTAPLQPLAVPPAGRPMMRSAADRLRDLAQLHRDGLLSDDEFERKRQALVDEL